MEWKYGELTRRVIACAMEVHRVLGAGFPEYVYRRALEIEFETASIASQSEYPLPLFFKGIHITTRRIDFMIEQLFGLEIKAKSALEPGDFVQSLNYISAWTLEFGMLINFGAPSLQFRRLDNKRFDPELAAREGKPKSG
jgi:GxxExxY protein